MKNNSSKTSFKRLNDENFKIVQQNETKNISGGRFEHGGHRGGGWHGGGWHGGRGWRTGILIFTLDYE